MNMRVIKSLDATAAEMGARPFCEVCTEITGRHWSSFKTNEEYTVDEVIAKLGFRSSFGFRYGKGVRPYMKPDEIEHAKERWERLRFRYERTAATLGESTSSHRTGPAAADAVGAAKALEIAVLAGLEAKLNKLVQLQRAASQYSGEVASVLVALSVASERSLVLLERLCRDFGVSEAGLPEYKNGAADVVSVAKPVADQQERL